MSTPAFADGPEAGVNFGGVIPLSKYRKTIAGDLGGTAGIEGGYRFNLSDNLALSLLGNPQFTMLPTENRCCGGRRLTDDVSSVFSITGGPRFSLITGPVETFAGAAGGYYRDVSGPMSDDGVGFNASGGVAIEVAPGTSLGFFGRYDYANMVAAPGQDVNRQWLSGGIQLQHVYEPEPRIAEAPPPPSPPPPPPPPVRRRIVLRGVNFDFDKYDIRRDARPILDEAIATLKDEPDIRISVEGHTDAIGSDAYNQGLSERRARSVADYLAAGGIARRRMTTDGFGESKPVASNTTEDGRAQNRRVELRIVGE